MTKIHCHGIVLLLLNGIQVVSLPMIFADNNFHAENLHLIMLSAIYNAAHVLHRCVIIIYAVMAWLPTLDMNTDIGLSHREVRMVLKRISDITNQMYNISL